MILLLVVWGVNGFAQPYYKAVNATSRSTVNPANPCAEKPCGNGNPNHRLFNGSGDFGFDMSSRFTEKQFRCLRCLGYKFVIIRAYRSSGEIDFCPTSLFVTPSFVKDNICVKWVLGDFILAALLCFYNPTWDLYILLIFTGQVDQNAVSNIAAARNAGFQDVDVYMYPKPKGGNAAQQFTDMGECKENGYCRNIGMLL